MGLTEEKWGHLAFGIIKSCNPYLKCCTTHLKLLFAEADNNCHLAGICAEQWHLVFNNGLWILYPAHACCNSTDIKGFALRMKSAHSTLLAEIKLGNSMLLKKSVIKTHNILLSFCYSSLTELNVLNQPLLSCRMDSVLLKTSLQTVTRSERPSCPCSIESSRITLLTTRRAQLAQGVPGALPTPLWFSHLLLHFSHHPVARCRINCLFID